MLTPQRSSLDLPLHRLQPSVFVPQVLRRELSVGQRGRRRLHRGYWVERGRWVCKEGVRDSGDRGWVQKSRGCAVRRCGGARVPPRTVTVALQRSSNLSMPVFSIWEKEPMVLWIQRTVVRCLYEERSKPTETTAWL